MDPYKTQRSRASSRPRICIVGAGVSGLRCADILLQHGFDVTILEARDRIGGRVCQAKLPSGQRIDIGPNWIHGTDDNPIMDLAKETNTVTYAWGEGFKEIFDESGKALEESNKLHGEMWDIVLEAFEYSAKNTSTIDPQLSLYDFFEEKVKERFPDATKHEHQRKIVMQFSRMWGAMVGSPVHQQSLKYFWLEECIEGETLFCASTYQKIMEHIAKPALDMGQVKLSTRVNHIDARDSTIAVHTEDGKQFHCDEVVMTAPLGWLKLHKDTFVPPLPPHFTQAVDAIGYGCLEKVYITFPKAFWSEGYTIRENQPSPGFTHWLPPSYSLDTNPNRWNQESVDLASLPDSCSHPTLLFYIFGDQSKAFSKVFAALPSQDAQEAYLTKFFKPYYSLLPHYVDMSPDCTPVSCIATNWVADELAGYGSYCNFQKGLQNGDKYIEIMREGLPDRGLWFAGEHTSPFVALGTISGAYMSGEAVAKRIVGAYDKAIVKSSL